MTMDGAGFYESHLRCFLLDGRGGGTQFVPGSPPSAEDTSGPFVWLHMWRDAPETAQNLTELGLDSFVIDALLADETRPRCVVHGPGALINLRGVNLSPEAEPEDMVSVRFWVEAHQVIGVWLRPLQSVQTVAEAVIGGHGKAPESPGDLIARIALRLADNAEPVVTALNEHIDDLEDEENGNSTLHTKAALRDLRRKSTVLRRYMMPQRDALSTLEIEDLPWLEARDRSRLREATDRMARLCEDLDAIRDRAQIVQDHFADLRAEQMNQQSLLLSVVAGIFLPLGLITGLLGINVGGIPGTQSSSAFWIVTVGIVVLGVGLYLWVRRRGLFR